MERDFLTYTILRSDIHDFIFGMAPMNKINSLETATKVKVNGKKSDGTEVTLYWLMKSGPRESLHITTARSGRFLHAVEAFSYRTLLPSFRVFQEMYGPFEDYPRLIDSRGRMSKEIFIIEDMKDKGYILKDCCEPLDFNHLAAVLKTYAHFHAISFAMIYRQPSVLEELHQQFTNCISMFGEDYYDISYKMNGRRILQMLDCDRYQEHSRLFRKFLQDMSALRAAILYRETFCGYAVFCHGGSNLLNILFKYGDKTKPNVPTKVCLIDFQMLRYGSPIFDLSYFIFTATDKATRDEHYDQLIDIYYREVCMRLEQMGSPPAVVFPYDKFQLRLKRFSVLGYFMAQMALYTMLRAPSIKVTDQMTEAEIKESMERNIVESEALYDERIKGMLIDFVEKGYFDFLDEEYPDMEFDESTTDSTDDNMVDEEDL